MEHTKRGAILTIAAILFALLALSDFLKPLTENDRTGLVLFGVRLHGLADAILAPLLGLILIAYAVGIWRMRRYAISLGWLYAAFVLANMTLFRIFNPPANQRDAILGIGFMIVAIAITAGTALILTRRRSELL
jgi:hypothetical protein